VYYEKDPQAWKVHSSAEAFTIFYTGVVASALAFAVQTWVIDRAGPVFASVYLPVQTILVAVMASVFFRRRILLGRVDWSNIDCGWTIPCCVGKR